MCFAMPHPLLLLRACFLAILRYATNIVDDMLCALATLPGTQAWENQVFRSWPYSLRLLCFGCQGDGGWSESRLPAIARRSAHSSTVYTTSFRWRGRGEAQFPARTKCKYGTWFPSSCFVFFFAVRERRGVELQIQQQVMSHVQECHCKE